MRVRPVQLHGVAVQGLFVLPAEEVFGPVRRFGGFRRPRSGVAGRSRGGALVFNGKFVLVKGIFWHVAAPALDFLLLIFDHKKNYL